MVRHPRRVWEGADYLGYRKTNAPVRFDKLGFPTTRREFDHFAKMLKQTAPGLAEDTLSALLKKAAEKEE